MTSRSSITAVAALVALVASSLGCGGEAASKPARPAAASGAAPSARGGFSQYSAIEYGAVRLAASAEQDQESRAAVDRAFRECMVKVPGARPTGSAKAAGKTLLVEPTITQIRKVSTAARIWGGAFAGNSSITVNVVFRDKENSRVVGTQAFGDSANAFAGAWSFGAGDRSMLDEAAQQVCAYLLASR